MVDDQLLADMMEAVAYVTEAWRRAQRQQRPRQYPYILENLMRHSGMNLLAWRSNPRLDEWLQTGLHMASADAPQVGELHRTQLLEIIESYCADRDATGRMPADDIATLIRLFREAISEVDTYEISRGPFTHEDHYCVHERIAEDWNVRIQREFGKIRPPSALYQAVVAFDSIIVERHTTKPCDDHGFVYVYHWDEPDLYFMPEAVQDYWQLLKDLISTGLVDRSREAPILLLEKYYEVVTGQAPILPAADVSNDLEAPSC